MRVLKKKCIFARFYAITIAAIINLFMPRKPIKNINTGHRHDVESSVRVEGDNLFSRFRAVVSDTRTHSIIGLIFIAFALFLTLAYVSYFFTGRQDFSILTQSESGANALRGEICNWVGLPGAYLSRWLVDGSFGIVSALFILLITLFGLQLMKAVNLRCWRVLFCCLFWLVWGSVTLGFVQQMLGWDTFFRWGGAHGEWLAALAVSYMKPLGVMIVIVLAFVIFMILTDRNFVPTMQRFWNWLYGKMFKKNKPDEDTAEPVAETNAPSDTVMLETSSATPVELIVENPPIEINPSDEEPKVDILEPEVKVELISSVDEGDCTMSNPDNTPPEPAETNEESRLHIEQVEEVELSEASPEYLLEKLGPFDPRKDLEHYKFPDLGLLKVYDNETAPIIDPAEQKANANRIVTTLRNYGIEIEQIKATVGPTVTLYEVVPKAGTRIVKIQSLENDIMLSLSAIGIRIIAPMPGKGTVGIEVPNEKPQVVSMHSVIASKRFQEEQKMRLPVAIGRTITNEVFVFDLAKTPHLLVAGATGQGKSVGLNAIITSLLYKKHPAELKFVLVDPKMVEFSIYKPLLRHYMAAMPDQEDRDIIITDCQKVINSLNSLVIEMEDRYSLLADASVRTVEDYNQKFQIRKLNPAKNVENIVTKKILHHRYMPYLVIIIDEYGDFIMQAGKEVERPIQRLAQKARAVGMHMILATQRPDVKIVTGTIKANIPTRIAFRTQSVVDSRTVLDQKGADQLIGKGDMLYSGGGSMTRIQCAFVDTPEVEAIVEHVASQQHYLAPYQLPEYIPEGGDVESVQPGAVDMKRLDPMFADVARYVVSKQEGSTSRLQRAFEIGYNRAGKLSDQLEAAGIVGPNKGPKGRDVLIQDSESLEQLLQQLGV